MSTYHDIQILKRRALSGRPDSKLAVHELCSALIESDDPYTIVDTLPAVTRFLSDHRPPPVNKDLVLDLNNVSLESQPIIVALSVFTAIQRGAATSVEIPPLQTSAMLCLRKNWVDLFAWSSFLVKSFVERDLDLHQALTRIGYEVLRTVLELFSTLQMLGGIRSQEIRAIEEAGDLFVRVHLYALFVEPSMVSDTMWVADEFSAIMVDEFLNDWDDLWGGIYLRNVQNFNPVFIPAIARILCRLTLDRPLNYNMLPGRFQVLCNVIARSDAFNGGLLQHRTVYFTTHLIRHVSKVLSHPETGPVSLNNLHIIRTWRWSVQYLFLAFSYDGYDSIILAVESGLLKALWRFSKIAMEKSNQGTLSLGIPELFGNLVGLIQASTIYRSIHKPLDSLLSKAPLNEVVESTDGSLEPENLWGLFKSLVLYRSDLRKQLEVTKIKLCSNVERCIDWVKKLHDGLPRTVEERDLKLARSSIELELWAARSHLLQRQIDHPKRSADDVLINLVDFSTLHGRWLWTSGPWMRPGKPCRMSIGILR
ncbi:hypothetical protein BT96DRAFT_919647 [Gymnopus androsaceus JB14]|uniref:Uncharacterized protein n=1 Tax=Gymnopus androsaceus JB14 TaxID=1447944 RepID=A0A6A4HU90_9AGAR|nr:hypothetical protein BT96DRAFT_919647 [Gymnopus androsaceus JB14]